MRTRKGKAKASSLSVGGKKLQLTNLDKPLWPKDGYTKGDLVAYYSSVARALLPYLADRPLMLERYPDGIKGESFYEKNAPRGIPAWVKTVSIASPGGKRTRINYVVCENEATLIYLANLAAITLHAWMSRVGSLDSPDFVLFDLDPWRGCTLSTLARVALGLRNALRKIGLTSLVKTSGGSGLHVMFALRSGYDYDQVKAFIELVTRRIAQTQAEDVTLERMTNKRQRGRVYIDYVQVGKGKTIVPPFVVRGREGAPVSMPLAWSQVEAMGRKRVADPADEFSKWTIANVPGLLRKHGDPWQKPMKKQQRLEPALKAARAAWR